MQEQQAAEAERAIALAASCEAARRNTAIMTYFERAETNLTEALLGCEDPSQLERLRVAANTVRKLRQFLNDGVDAGEWAAEMLKQARKAEGSR